MIFLLLLQHVVLMMLPSFSHAQLICLNIQAIQGTGSESIRLGDIVKVCGATITSIQFNGFTMQMPPADPNYAASSALFVRSFNTDVLKVGDFVNVEGTVFEFTGRTVLDRAYVTKRGNSRDVFPMIDIQLPVNSIADYQRYESMQVRVLPRSNYDMVIADYEQFDYTDSIGVCAVDTDTGRPFQYTTYHAPSVAGFAAHQGKLVLSCLHVIGNTRSFLYRIDTFENRIRGGSQVTVLQGTLGITVNAKRWEIAPSIDANFQYTANPRSDPPIMTGADLIVASSNVGTYKQDAVDFNKQVAKLILGLAEMNADIYAVQGIAVGSSGGKDLASRLTTKISGRSYKSIMSEAGIAKLGNGATRVDIIYDSTKLVFLKAAVLNDDTLVDTSLLSDSTIGTIFNQPFSGSCFPLAASFIDANNNLVTVVSTQFITRTYTPFLFDIIGTPDKNSFDGAGDFNLLRTIQAQALVAWLGSNPTGVSKGAVVVAGSLNSFAAEDPIGAMESSGFTSLTGPDSYNYGNSLGFGSTDYIFVKDTSNIAGQVWHVNADEIPIISYRNCVAAGFCRDDSTLFDSSVPARYARRDPLMAGIAFGGNGGASLCFSGTTTVETRSGPHLMRDLQVGDEILVSKEDGVYEPVYSFGHSNDSMKGKFLQFLPSGLEITPDHMIFRNDGKAIPAANVQVGDVFSGVKITSIKEVTREGVFAPFTPSGKLFVNGLQVSSYVAFDSGDALTIAGIFPLSYQWLAHMFQFPQRVFCHHLGFKAERYDINGVSTWVSTPLRIWQWTLDQHVVVITLAALLFASVATIFYLLENFSLVLVATIILAYLCSTSRVRITATKQKMQH